MSVVFTKTRKGQEEIEHRSAGLGPRARRLLILLDGKRPLDEVRTLMPDPKLDETLLVLQDGAFIEEHGGLSEVSATVSADVARTVTDDGPIDPVRLEKARNFMLNSMRTFNGPYGNVDLMTRINECRSGGALHGLVGDWLDAIKLTKMGRLRAEELKIKLLEVL